MCGADSSFFRHLSQMGLYINSILKRCLFRWQCPVTHRNCLLFSFNSSLVLLTESPCRNPFGCLSPIKDSHYFLWSLFSPWQPSWQFLLKCVKLVQVLWTDIQILILPVDQQFCYLQYPCDPHPHQLNSVMLSQFHERLMTAPKQFWVDLVIVMCFNCSLTVW
jgi:hypothetical protein